MIAQAVFTLMLLAVMLVAFAQFPQIPLVGGAVICAARFRRLHCLECQITRHTSPTCLGIGRGADLVLYIWVLISCAILLLLYLNIREQLQLITTLARKMALADALREKKVPVARQNTPAK